MSFVALCAAGPAAAAPPGVDMPGVVVSGPTTATFSARVDPGGLPTTAYFEYGTTPDLGQRTPDVAVAASGSVRITAKVTDLAPGTHYYLAVHAANADDDGYGEDGAQFDTPRTPALDALPATGVRPVAATLHVKVATRGLPVTLTGSLVRMSFVPVGTPNAPIPVGPVTVTADGDVALPVSGLVPDGLYHWTVSAQSDGGTATARGTLSTPRLIGVAVPRASVRVAPYGSPVTFSGAIPTAAGLPLALHQQPFPYLAPFAAITGATGNAGPGGEYTLTVPALQRARYAVAVGSPDYVAPVAGTAVEVRVAATVRAGVARARGHRFVVSGSYAPDVPARVSLFRRGHGRSGVAVAGRRAAGGRRAFRFPARALKPGAYEVRVVVAAGVEVEDARSASFRIPRR
jgi:hypothetical protein